MSVAFLGVTDAALFVKNGPLLFAVCCLLLAASSLVQERLMGQEMYSRYARTPTALSTVRGAEAAGVRWAIYTLRRIAL